jgi:hypothetical protein
MDELSVIAYINQTFPEVESTVAYGYTMFFYRSDRIVSFATIISSDYDYDHVSNLDRPGVFRLNIGISRETFQSLFGSDKVDINNYDFTALDVIMPHPDYAPQHYVCVLSPSDETFERSVRPLLAEAYELAARKFNRRSKTGPSNNSPITS